MITTINEFKQSLNENNNNLIVGAMYVVTEEINGVSTEIKQDIDFPIGSYLKIIAIETNYVKCDEINQYGESLNEYNETWNFDLPEFINCTELTQIKNNI
jgi:hypothetical protein